MFSTHNRDTIRLQKEMHNHFSKIAYRSPDFIIPHSLSENKNEALFIVLSKRFPPISNPISIHVFGRTKIHLTALRHRATTPTHQVVLITTITRAACGSGLHPRSCGNPLLRDDVVLPPSLAPSSYTWCDVMQPHSRVGRIITKTHSVA